MSTQEQNAQNKAIIYGESVVSNGLEVMGEIDGLGLATFGLIWLLGDIWIDWDTTPTSTSWSAAEASVTTNWNAEAAVSTTWSDPQSGGIWGEDVGLP